MELLTSIDQAKQCVYGWKAHGCSIALVPTMGFLHDGHASLIKAARKACDKVVVSVFVNPTQFAPGEDFDAYPRDMQADSALCERLGVDAIFYPQADEMFVNQRAYCFVEQLTSSMEGAARPIHFRGVCTVVCKLFHIIAPDVAFFGEKDAQQLAIIKRMVRDLNFDIRIVGMPIVRESDGLAKSSRNTYLSPEGRRAACVLYRAICKGKSLIAAGMPADDLYAAMKAVCAQEPLCSLEYICLVDADTMQEIPVVAGNVVCCMAARIQNVRLIDNFWWHEHAEQ